MRTAVFTGAGASRAFGFPLTREIMPRLRRRLLKGDLFDAGAAGQRKQALLLVYLRELLPGFNKVRALPSITDVLSLIDYSIVTEIAPMRSRTPLELRHFRRLLDEALFTVLAWPYGEDDTPRVLERFASWIEEQSAAREDSVALITSNYDLAIDDMLFWSRNYDTATIAANIDFGFAWRDPLAEEPELRLRPKDPSLSIFKLHGSLNWLRCDECDHIYVNPDGVIAHQAFRDDVDDRNTCDCDHAPLRQVIVAPSLVREVRDVNLMEVWKASLEYLRRADRWVIIGYSFPSEDLAIRTMFMRAYNGRSKPPRISVVQPQFEDELRSRYRVLFPGFRPVTGGIEGFVRSLDTPRRRHRKRAPSRLLHELRGKRSVKLK